MSKKLSVDQRIRMRCLEQAVQFGLRLSGGVKTREIPAIADCFTRYVGHGEVPHQWFHTEPPLTLHPDEEAEREVAFQKEREEKDHELGEEAGV